MESYVTASCTDGNTYVWDTSQGDGAIHILGHGGKLSLRFFLRSPNPDHRQNHWIIRFMTCHGKKQTPE
jgi:hypothetical protein